MDPYSFSRTDYNEIIKCIEKARGYSSLKQAKPYIDRIRFIGNGIYGPAGLKVSEIACELSEYCKTNADKYRHEYLLSNLMGPLESMINSEENK